MSKWISIDTGLGLLLLILIGIVYAYDYPEDTSSLLAYDQQENIYVNSARFLSAVDGDPEYAEAGHYREWQRSMHLWADRLAPSGSIAQAATAINEYNCTYRYEPSPYEPQWKNLGPIGKPAGSSYTGNGQIHRIQFDPAYDRSTEFTKYCISHFGGLWKSTTEETFWEPLTDRQLPGTTVADLAIDPQDGEHLFIATGDGDYGRLFVKDRPVSIAGLRIGPTQTAGVYRSMDGGTRWTRINGPNNSLCNVFSGGGNMRRIRSHPSDGNTLFVASTEGILRTENALDAPDSISWEIVLSRAETGDTEWRGLAFHPGSDGRIVYASGADIYRSEDGGSSWKSMTGRGTGLDLNNMPQGVTDFRINVETSPAAPDRVYAYLFGVDQDQSCEECMERCKRLKKCKSKTCMLASQYAWIYIYKDGKWHEIKEFNSCSAFHAVQRRWLGLAVHPEDPNQLYVGTTKVHGSRPGTSWEDLISGDGIIDYSSYNSSGLHADIHELRFEPAGKDGGPIRLWAGSHGGVSYHRMDSIGHRRVKNGWSRQDDGLSVATIWNMDQSSQHRYQMMLGLQDNGVVAQTARQIDTTSAWKCILSGDGYGVAFNPLTNTAWFNNQSRLYRVDNYNLKIKHSETEYVPDDPIDGYRSFIRYLAGQLHPVRDAYYIAFAEVYERLIDFPTKKNTNKEVYAIRSDIGKSVGAGWKREIYGWEIAESDTSILYVVSTGNDGLPPDEWYTNPSIYRSTRGGCIGASTYGDPKGDLRCMERLSLPPVENIQHYGDTDYPLIMDLAVDPGNAHRIFVCFSGYDPRFKVWSWTYDKLSGKSYWINEDPEGSLANLPVNQIIYQKGTDKRLYIGTDAGVFIKDEGSHRWVRYGDFPPVRVGFMKANYCSQELTVGTWGRGAWIGDMLPMSTDYPSYYEVTGRDTLLWDYNRPIDRSIKIRDGACLKLSRIAYSMPANSRIVIEPGGSLILDRARLYNSCGKSWKGITVENKTDSSGVARSGKLIQKESRMDDMESPVRYIWKD